MSKVDFDELFFDFLEAAKEYVPYSDHVVMCVEVLRSLDDKGYNIKELYGQDDVVDEALEEIYPSLIDDESEYEDYED